ncbi:MAG: hypothetical protein KC445_12485 [Anaerolineales bacterium]|nr:hypothetical protein [Anaerolineales bacterium]
MTIQLILLLLAVTGIVYFLVTRGVQKAKTLQQRPTTASRVMGLGLETGVYALLTFYILWAIGILLSLNQ